MLGNTTHKCEGAAQQLDAGADEARASSDWAVRSAQLIRVFDRLAKKRETSRRGEKA